MLITINCLSCVLEENVTEHNEFNTFYRYGCSSLFKFVTRKIVLNFLNDIFLVKSLNQFVALRAEYLGTHPKSTPTLNTHKVVVSLDNS